LQRSNAREHPNLFLGKEKMCHRYTVDTQEKKKTVPHNPDYAFNCAAPSSFLVDQKKWGKNKILKYNNMIIPETWVCGKSTKVSFPSDGSSHKDHALCQAFLLLKYWAHF
jgi:hypothetical protein